MGRKDEEQPVFEQLTLKDFKKWSSTSLKALSQVWEHFWKLKALWKWWKMISTLNTLLVVMVFKFLSWIFGHAEKRLD